MTRHNDLVHAFAVQPSRNIEMVMDIGDGDWRW